MKVLIVENGYNDLKKSRFPLGEYFQKSGFLVNYACPDPLDKDVFYIPMSRNNMAPMQLVSGARSLKKLEVDVAADFVLSFRFIPNVLNYLSSLSSNRIKRAAVITGLGYAFISTNNSFRYNLLRTCIRLFYRLASKRIFIVAQNPDDLKDLGVINGKVILGSGVNSDDSIKRAQFHSSSIKLLYVGRLIRSKGFIDVIKIYEQLKAFKPETTLTIAGTNDPDNPDSISDEELSKLKKMEGINYLGFINNMDSVYSNCNVLLFPSIYREGVPRAIVESLKYGLTIVTRNMPGCKETVSLNGFLIKDKYNSKEVIDYLLGLDSEKLLENRHYSLKLFEDVFSSKTIYPQYLELILKS